MKKRSLLVVSSMLLLGGCALPPLITAVTYAVDGISYVASGKGLADHALSAAADRDCAMFRVVMNEAICRGEAVPNDATVLAMVDTGARENAEPGEKASSHLLYIGIRERGSWAIDASMDVQGAPQLASFPETLIHANALPVSVDAAKHAVGQTVLENFSATTELYAMLQDNGTLELFAYEPVRTDRSDGLTLVARYLNFDRNLGGAPDISMNGRVFHVAELLV